jgi:glycosyltransferase involved in cell wall biosynthesis
MSELPKVSGILPVGYGDTYFRVAAAAFLASTYEGELELIILDNNEQPIESLIPDDPRVKYYHCDRMPVGALRNLGTSSATGDICITIDEDDWSHPERVGEQVGRLIGTGKQVTGFHSIYYFDMSNSGTYKYWFEPNRPHVPYACGSSQCYKRSWWDKHKFPETGIEDYAFQGEALAANELDSVDGAELLVARAHDSSVCHPTQLGTHRQFPVVPKEELPAEFYAAIAPKAAVKPQPRKKNSKAAGDQPCPLPPQA